MSRDLPFLILGVGEGDRSLHNDVEELVAPLGDVVLREGGNQLHRYESAIDLFRDLHGVPECDRRLIEDPEGPFVDGLVSLKEQHTGFG